MSKKKKIPNVMGDNKFDTGLPGSIVFWLIWTLLAVGLLVILSSGCASSKKSLDKTEETMIRTGSAQHDVKTISIETVDTLIELPSSEVSFSRHINELMAGKPIVATNNGSTVTVAFDSLTGNVNVQGHFQPAPVPVRIDRRTEVTDKSLFTSAELHHTEIKSKHKEREPAIMAWAGGFFILLLLLLLLRWILKRLNRWPL